jgi:hypothetical protein
MLNAMPTSRTIGCLEFLADRVAKEAADDPHLSGGDRASLMMASALITQVRDRHVGLVASRN